MGLSVQLGSVDPSGWDEYWGQMSLLMFNHEETAALIVTDTLATTPAGEPLMLQSKAWRIPHLNMAVAVTGVANLGAAWNDFLRSSAVALDLQMVDAFAPRELRRIWTQLLAENSPSPELAATIYHFGFVEGFDRLIRYVYRSKNDFESELIDGTGFGIKPPPSSFGLAAPNTLDEYIELAVKIKAEQDGAPAEDRVYIGGDLFMTYIQNWQSQTARIHRFDGFDEAWLSMNARL